MIERNCCIHLDKEQISYKVIVKFTENVCS